MNESISENGIEVPAVTADQMREIDRIAMEETGPNFYQMMQNAGRNLASLAMDLLGNSWNSTKILVLSGTGGNSGGGICAAHHLANRNVNVKLCLSNPEQLADVPFFQLKIYGNIPGKLVLLNELGLKKFDLIIDALIGYSLKGAPPGTVSELIRSANQAKTPILLLDVPSGVDSTTGKTPDKFIHATWTMTLALPKSGPNPETAGAIFFADIGIPEKYFEKMDIKYTTLFGKDFYIRLKENLTNF